MRISKAPEVRKQEIIDTAMRLFMEKGYETTSISDIAREMNVVSGLCYRYFKSKEELYNTAVTMYAEQCCAPLIAILQKEYDSLEQLCMTLIQNFIHTDGKETYHEFYHKEGNEGFHRQLEAHMNNMLCPYVEKILRKFNEQGKIHVDDVVASSQFILYGQMPILNDETLSPEQKVERIIPIITKILV